MDVLTNKNYAPASYTCRYTAVPYYYNTADDKYVYGLSSNMDKNLSYFLHEVKETDNLDYLALKYYNNPTYYWVIAYFNDIGGEIFDNLYENYKVLKIPPISSIKFGDER